MKSQAWGKHIAVESKREGLPPLLVIQAGPGLPVMNERKRFRRLLGLETHFTVVYWDRSGAGLNEAGSRPLTLERHQEELSHILELLRERTGSKTTILGISIGGTLGILARKRDADKIERIVAISPDVDVAQSDLAAYDGIRAAVNRPEWKHLAEAAGRLRPPPCVDPRQFQLRAALLGDLGALEYGKPYSTQLRKTVLSILGSYGPLALPRVLANIQRSLRDLLPQLASLKLLTQWPSSSVPLDLVFGETDILQPPKMVSSLKSLLGVRDTINVVPKAGHMVHVDAPSFVRQIAMRKPATLEGTYLTETPHEPGR